MIPPTHPLASVRDAYNAVFVESEAAGQLMFYGRGAGGAPTATAVLGDLVAVGRNRISGGHGPRETAYADLPVLPMGAAETRYYISIDVADKTGVLAPVAQTFAAHGVSIETVRQDGHGDDAALVVVTHQATEASLAAVEALRATDVVREVSQRHAGRRGLTVPTSEVSSATTRGAASSRSTATGCPSARPRPSSRCARAARRSSAPTSSPSAPAARCTSRSRAPTRPGPSRTAA